MRLGTYLESAPALGGAMAKGPDNFADSWVDSKITVNGYILSANVVCTLLVDASDNRCFKFAPACEYLWGVL
jgi:rRNA small subunit pseudouridine methyltransferase Nep1